MRKLLLCACVVAAVALAGVRPKAQSETKVFEDFFVGLATAPAGDCGPEALSIHKPNLGLKWTIAVNSGGPTYEWKATAFRKWLSPCLGNPGQRIMYVADPGVALSPDYYAEFELADTMGNSKTSFMGASFRKQPGVVTYYGFGIRPICYPYIPGAPAPDNNSNCRDFTYDGVLWVSVNDVETILDTCNCNWKAMIGASDNDVIQFGGDGNYIYVKRNGVVVLDATNNAITQAGLPGLLGGAWVGATDKADSGAAYDNYRVVDKHGSTPPPPQPTTFNTSGAGCPIVSGTVTESNPLVFSPSVGPLSAGVCVISINKP